MKNTVILVSKNGMGTAEELLQHTLFGKYLDLLLQGGDPPNAICFYTEGVRLVCKGSPFIEQLQQLETKGVRLIICSTCLNYYDLTDKVQTGIVGGMGDIIEAQIKAEKVISI
jgi:hypothetical protein